MCRCGVDVNGSGSGCGYMGWDYVI
jgi:hypothetical protein